jgi:hypothetical protein
MKEVSGPEVPVPGWPISAEEIQAEGFVPLLIEVRAVAIAFHFGSGCEWTTVGSVPKGPGVYAFTVGDDDALHVTYVGLTEELWMVTKGRLPNGAARPGQRYGRPLYAGVTRQRINCLVDEQLRLGRRVRHWVAPLNSDVRNRTELRKELLYREQDLIQRWNLRRQGWNRG